MFIIPSKGNRITEKDLEKFQVRITVDFKIYFPTNSRKIELVNDNKNYLVSFTYRVGRSHVLKLERELVSALMLSSGDSLKFNKLNNNKFSINVIKK